MLFDLQRSEHDGWTRVAVIGELDLAAAPRVRSAVLGLLPSPVGPAPDEPLRFILDLSGVDFIDSAGLGVVLGAVRRVRGAGGTVGVVLGSDHVRDVFSLIGLDRILAVFPNVDAVIAGAGERPAQPADGVLDEGGRRG